MGEKAAAVFETRCPHTTLATLYRYFVEEGRAPRTRCQLTTYALKLLEEILTQNGHERVETYEEALRILDPLGSLQRGGRGIKALAKQLEFEGREEYKKNIPGLEKVLSMLDEEKRGDEK